MAKLSDLIQRQSFGFPGIEGQLFDEISNRNLREMPPDTSNYPQNAPLPRNYMQRSGGPVIDLGPSVQTQEFRGSPVDVFGQGKGYMQPDGTIVGVNREGKIFKVQPEGTAAAQRSGNDAALKRRMLTAQIQQAEEKLGRGGLSPAEQLAREKFELEKSQGPKMTEAQAKATTFASQMAAASNELDKLESGGYNPSGTATQFETRMAGGLGNILTSPKAQRAKQTQNQWSEAFLRVKTGAAATQPEVELNNKTFFPQIGDSKGVIDQKRRMRIQAEQDVLNMSGGGRNLATQHKPQPDQQDAEAIAWAKANPNDPRSSRILSLHGM